MILTSSSTYEIDEKKFNIYPNPSSQNAHLSYTLQKSSEVGFEIFDAVGKKSACLMENQVQGPGTYEISIDRDELLLIDGIYMVKMIIDGRESLQKMILLH